MVRANCCGGSIFEVLSYFGVRERVFLEVVFCRVLGVCVAFVVS